MLTSVAIRLSGACGPLEFNVRAADEELAAVARSYFSLYSAPWERTKRIVDVEMLREQPCGRARGTFLTAAHMTVDIGPGGYFADTQYGFTAHGRCGGQRDEWTVTVPHDTAFGEPQIGDMEDLFSLICTAGWRAEGYVPLHAGAIVKNGVCAILCAGSGGGKSTLTTAMVLGGWATLGDDKLLLRHELGLPVLHSLLQTFNLDPATRRWFALGELDALPRYSAFTDKRRVPLNYLRTGAAATTARPTHVVSVKRDSTGSGIRSRSMDRTETAATLLRQIVLPSDREASRAIVGQVMNLVAHVQGVHLEIGENAYLRDGWLHDVEGAFR